MTKLGGRLTERQRAIAWIASVVVVFFAVSRLSLLGAVGAAGISPIWPPTGIYLSAVLLTRKEHRPWLVGALFLTDLASQLSASQTVLVGVVYALVDVGDVVLGAWLILRFIGPSITFSKVREVFGFIAFSVIFSNCLMSLLAATMATRVYGTGFWDSWRTWATSDAIGNLLITPLVITWARPTGRLTWNLQRRVEALSLVLLLAIVTLFAFVVFTEQGEAALPSTYLCFPLLLWTALRFNLRFVTSALVGVAVIAVAAAVGAGTSPSFGTNVDEVILVQLFVATMTVPALILAASVAERRESLQALGKSEALLGSVLEGTSDAIFAKDRDGFYLLANAAAAQMFGKRPDELVGKHDSDIFPEAEAEIIKEHDRGIMGGSETQTHQETLTLADGTAHTFLTSKGPLVGQHGEVLGLVGVARDISELAKSQQERDRLRERMSNAQEEERRRIAADIHDDSIQPMTAVGLRLGALRHLVASGGSDDAAFASLEVSVERAITRLRHLMFELRPPALDEQGLVAAIRGYIATESRNEGFRFDLRDGLDEEPDASVRAGLYRIVQEAVRNTSKHADATRISVTISSENGGVGLEIEDDGNGFEAESESSPDHFGLAGIRERASMMGGRATIESSPGAGTTVRVWTPSHRK